jgi:hypothetical protein
MTTGVPPSSDTHPPEPCPYRVVLEGRECACPRMGPHLVHRYRSPGGKRHEFVFHELNRSKVNRMN